MRYIFISYSRQRSAVVDALTSRLNQVGVDVWRDTASLPAGVNWKRQVNDAIRGADLVVMCTSPEWYDSRACQEEGDCAGYYHRPHVEIPVDAAERDLDRAVNAVVAALAAVTAEDRLVSDIEVSAGAWLEGGARSRDLARGRYLKELNRVFGRGRGVVTDAARRYLIRSIRHRRIKRIMAALAVMVVILAILIPWNLKTQMDTIGRLETESRVISSHRRALDAAMGKGPYEALKTVLAFPKDGRFNSTDYLTELHTALSVKTPVERGAVSDSRYEDFSFSHPRGATASSSDRVRTANVGADGSVSIRRSGTSGAAEGEVGVLSVSDLGVGRARMVAFSPDGLYLAALAERGIVIIDPRLASVVMTLSGADVSGAGNITWNGDGSRIAVELSDGTVDVWEVRSRTEVVSRTDLWIVGGTSFDGGRKAAFLGRDGRIVVVDGGSGKVESTETALASEDVDAYEITGGPESDKVYVIAQRGDDYALYGVDLASHKTSRFEVSDQCQPRHVAQDAKGVVIDCGSKIAVLRVDTGAIVDTIDGYPNVSALGVNGEGRVFVGIGSGAIGVGQIGSSDSGKLRLAADGRIMGAFIGECPGGVVQAIAAGADRALAVGNGTTVGNCSRSLRPSNDRWAGGAWTIGAGLMPYTTDATSAQSRAVAISPDGSQFAVGLSNGAIALLRADMQPGWAWREQPGEMRGVVYSPDGNYVFGATREGLIVRVPSYPESFTVKDMRAQARAVLDRARRLGLCDVK